MRFKPLFAAAALALASLSLGACAGLQAPPGPAAALQATAVDDKALYAAEAVYNVAAEAYVAAEANGLLSPDTKAQAKAILANAYKVLTGARAAYAAGNASAFNSQLNQLTILKNAILQLIPK
jgi:hypothetical protein